jgi:hypothetical protein
VQHAIGLAVADAAQHHGLGLIGAGHRAQHDDAGAGR